MEQLSKRDKAILNCIFNPNLPLEESTEENEKLEDFEESTSDIEKSKELEIEAVKITENGNIDGGLELINKAIAIAPNRPSLYNNRAHIYQFLRRFEDAYNDLTKTIDLCNENNYKKTLCQAYCQRGLLHRRAERSEEAVEDFQKAAKFGSKFAKSQVVELNPYAALCNQMLRQVMEKLD